jgi:hypothetical protein
MNRAVAVGALVLAAVGGITVPAEAAARIEFLRTPEGTYQPQALVDRGGTVHVVALSGDPGAADVVYYRLPPGSNSFGKAVRVNTQPGSAIAVGTIRGAQLALGRDGRIHIVWNGSDKARPRNTFGGSPVLYTRSSPDGLGFEPERNVMARTSVLDGGASVAADDSGNVYVTWHGSAEDAPDGELGRKLYVARSTDDGRIFAPERPALEDSSGVCACCGVAARVGSEGRLMILYRGARTLLDRDLILAVSDDHGSHFRWTTVAPWKIKACPVSRAAIAESPAGPILAWESYDRLSWARLDERTGRISEPTAASGVAKQRHPALAANAKGEVLLAWTEGTGWQKGGDLVWQLYDAQGWPTDQRGRIKGGIPVWGLPAVVARGDGSFLVIH